MTQQKHELNKDASKWVSYVIDKTGLNEKQALALMGNLSMESLGLHNTQELDPTVKGSKGGTGWGQWTGPRRKQFEAFVDKNNLDINSDEANAKFLVNDLKNTDGKSTVPNFLNSLKKTSTTDEANNLTVNQYLFPKNRDTLDTRKGFINELSDVFNSSKNQFQEDKYEPSFKLPDVVQPDLTDTPQEPVEAPSYEPTQEIKQPEIPLEQQQEAQNDLQEDVIGYTDENAIKLGGEAWEQVYTQTGNVGLKKPLTTQDFNDSSKAYGPNTVQTSSTLPHIVDVNKKHELSDNSWSVKGAPDAPEVGLGIFSTALETIKRNSFVGNIAQEQSFRNAVLDDSGDEAPAGWTWKTDLEPILEATPSEYWNRFLYAKNPRQRENIINWIHDQEVKNEQYDNGSYIGAFGGAVISGLSPEILYPLGMAMKSAKMSTTALHFNLAASTGIAMSAISHNYLMQTTVATGNLSDFAYDTFIDTTAGLLFVGASNVPRLAKTLGDKLDGWSINARKQAKYGSQGITPKFKLLENGTIDTKNPYVADVAGADNSTQSVGAAEVAEAHEFYQSGLSEEGLFKWIGFRNIAKWISPQFKGLNSGNSVVNFITLRTDDTVIKTIGNKDIQANPINFLSRFAYYNDKTSQAAGQLLSLFYEANGMGAGQNNGDALRRAATRLSSGLDMDWDAFGEEVILATINGLAHSNPKVNEAAALFFNEQLETFTRFGKIFNYPTNEAFVKTANQYANIVYDRHELKKRPKDFRDMSIASQIERNKLINVHMNPINEMVEHLASLKDLKAERELDIALTPDELAAVDTKIKTKETLFKIAESPEDKAAIKAEILELKKSRRRKGVFSLADRGEMDFDIEVAKANLLNERRKVADLARSTPETTMAIENFDGVSGEDSLAIQGILEPKKKAEAEHSKKKRKVALSENAEKKIKKEIVALKKKRALVNEETYVSTDKNKSRRDRKHKIFNEKLNAKKEALNKEIQKAEEALVKNNAKKDIALSEAQETERKVLEEQHKINVAIDSNQYHQKLTRWIGEPDKPFAKRVLRDPNNLYKFHKPYAANEMDSNARSYLEAILGTSDGDITADIMGSLSGMSSENSLSSRTHMIAHNELIKNKFVETDPVKLLKLYNGRLNRLVAMKEAYGMVEPDGNIRQLITKFTKENNAKRAKIEEIENKDEREKASLALEKAIDDDTQFLKNVMFRVTGKSHGTPKQKEMTKAARNIASFIMLGSVPLSMITDPMFAMLKNGVWPTISNSIHPFLSELSRGDNSNKEFAHFLGLAMEGEAHNLSSRWFDGINSGDLTKTGVISSALEKAARLTSKLALTNAINNAQERILAMTNDAAFLKSLQLYKEGKLSKGRTQALLQYGIELDKMGDRILAQFEKYGDGRNSQAHLWTDKEAQRVWTDAIRSSVRDILIKKDLLTNPFWTDTQIGSLVSLFKSWSFTAFARFTIPLMQSPDVDKIIGSILAIGIGSLVAPLRRLSRGDDAFKDDNSMFVDGVVDGGVGSIFSDIINLANSLTGNRLLGGFVGDKYRQVNFASAIAGPFGNVGGSIFDLIGKAMEGKYGEKEAKKTARLLPFLSFWYDKQVVDKIIEHQFKG